MAIRGIWLSLRLILPIGGGYAFTAAAVATATTAISHAGLVRSEAVVLASMLGFPFYLGVLIWAFSERRLSRLIVVLVVAPLLLAFALWLTR
jgi:hypothetical protein